MNALSPFRFIYARLRTSEPWMQSAPRVERALAEWPLGRCMGVFMGLFGLTNHELVVLLSVHDAGAHGETPNHRLAASDPGSDAPDCRTIDLKTVAARRATLRACLPSDVEIIEVLPLRATVRPTTDAPFARAGIHVFRLFTLPFDRMDEAVTLSSAGWETFERRDDPQASDGYRTEPMGLFAQDGPHWRCGDAPAHESPTDGLADPGQLLLVTWYDSMSSWERSRSPNPQATVNFRKRAALTSSVVAYATRVANTA